MVICLLRFIPTRISNPAFLTRVLPVVILTPRPIIFTFTYCSNVLCNQDLYTIQFQEEGFVFVVTSWAAVNIKLKHGISDSLY